MALSSTPDNNDSHQSEPSFESSNFSSDDTDWLSRLETLESLAQIVREENLGELDVRLGGARLKIKAQAKPARTIAASAASETESGQSPYDESRAIAPLETKSVADANLASVISPMVGLFYRAPSPADPVFVSVGDRVEVGQTVGLIETMKVFNEITSEVEGTVVSIAFENGQLIETGDAIMAIRRAQL